MDEQEQQKIRDATEAELQARHRDARIQLGEYMEAADNKDNENAHFDWDKAGQKLDAPGSEIHEKAQKLYQEVDAVATEFMKRKERQSMEAARDSNIDFGGTFRPSQGGFAQEAPKVGIDYLVSKEDADFQKEFSEMASFHPRDNGGRVDKVFSKASIGDVLMADNTKSTSVGPNDDLSRSGIIMYNDPMVPIAARLPRIPLTKGDTYTYFKESGAGGFDSGNQKSNAVAVKAEAATFAEQEFLGKTTKVVVEKLTGYAVVTDEILADVDFSRNFFNTRFIRNFAQKVEEQVVKGTGQNNQWAGLVAQSNRQTEVITTAAAKTNPKKFFDVFIDGWQKLIGTAHVTPSLIAMPSANVSQFAKKRDTDGRYIWSNVANGMPTFLFGLPVVISEHLAANSAIMLDTSEFAILDRQGLETEWGYNGTDFINGKQTVRGTQRGNLVALRENALVHITGLENVDV